MTIINFNKAFLKLMKAPYNQNGLHACVHCTRRPLYLRFMRSIPFHPPVVVEFASVLNCHDKMSNFGSIPKTVAKQSQDVRKIASINGA